MRYEVFRFEVYRDSKPDFFLKEEKINLTLDCKIMQYEKKETLR